MTHDDLTRWLSAGLDDIQQLRPDWQPSTQGQASTWVWATVIRAANEKTPQGWLGSPWHPTKNPDDRQIRIELVRDHWLRAPDFKGATTRYQVGDRGWSKYEVLLDFTVSRYVHQPRPVRLGVESEMHASHGTGDSLGMMNEDESVGRKQAVYDDYTWDFYKLLLVSCPVRLFFARVGTLGTTSIATRSENLRKSLNSVLPHSIRNHQAEPPTPAFGGNGTVSHARSSAWHATFVVTRASSWRA